MIDVAQDETYAPCSVSGGRPSPKRSRSSSTGQSSVVQRTGSASRCEAGTTRASSVKENAVPWWSSRGLLPETVRSGTHVCKYVRCLVPKRSWVTLFEDVHDATMRVRRGSFLPPPTREAAGFLGLEIYAQAEPDVNLTNGVRTYRTSPGVGLRFTC